MNRQTSNYQNIDENDGLALSYRQAQKMQTIKNPTNIEENFYKNDFPLLQNNSNIVYLDSAATTQRPNCVIDAQSWYQKNLNANPLRGVYQLSIRATSAIDATRDVVANLLGTNNKNAIVFTKNATESLNLLALRYAPIVLKEGDEVCISIMEHHSNLIPWQIACKQTGAHLVYLYPNKHGEIEQCEIEKKITHKTKIVSITHVSNVLGTITPVKKIAYFAHRFGAKVFIDGAQSIAHMPINVDALGCDAFVFSGHKVFSPTGIGVLWAKDEIMEKMPPLLTGGEMISDVTKYSATWASIPYKFEAGTQDGAGIYGLHAALIYLKSIGYETLEKRETNLIKECMAQLNKLDFIEIIGSLLDSKHIGVISFNVKGIHPHDVASILDEKGVCIRAGHHCAKPLLTWLNIGSCCRVSFSIYNDQSDINQLILGLNEVWRVFHGSN